MNDNQSRLEELLFNSASPSFPDTERAELNALLRDNADARAFASRFLTLDALLAESLAASEARQHHTVEFKPIPVSAGKTARNRPTWLARAAAWIGAFHLFGETAKAATATSTAVNGTTVITQSTIAILMKKSIITITFAILVLGGSAILVIQRYNESSRNAGSKAGKDAPLSSGEDIQSRAPERSRTRAVPKDQELVAKYGESRTSLSRQVATTVVGILEDAVRAGETMQAGQAGFGGLVVALDGLFLELALTEEQIGKATTTYTDYHKRQLEKTKEAVERLKQNPAPLMKLMLASDANARGKIQDDEYKRLQTESGKDLAGVLNPLDRIIIGGSPLNDEAFLSEFKSTLDPEQNRKLEESMAREAAATPPPATGIDEGNISNMPKMELEKLDASIQDARKITTGIKGIMEVFEKSYTTPPAAAPEGGEN